MFELFIRNKKEVKEIRKAHGLHVYEFISFYENGKGKFTKYNCMPNDEPTLIKFVVENSNSYN